MTNSDGLVEVVARAMVQVEFGQMDGDKLNEWMARPEFAENYRKLARAAIEAYEQAALSGSPEG